MSFPNELKLRYGVSTAEEYFKLKTANDKRQIKPSFTKVQPRNVEISEDECRKLCEATGLEFHQGLQNRVIERVTTTEAVDRDGEIVRATGIDNSDFRIEPVVLFAHDRGNLPVGRSLKEWIDKDIVGWRSWDVYFDDIIDPSKRSDIVFRMVSSGAMRGGSIGFLPVEAKFDHTDQERADLGLGRFGVEFKRIRKLEHSACSVPSHQEALANNLKCINGKEFKNLFSKNDCDILESYCMLDNNLIDILYNTLGVKRVFSIPKSIINNKTTCKKCNFTFDYISVNEIAMGAVKCSNCKTVIDQEGNVLDGIEEEKITDDYIQKPYPNEHAARIRDPDDFEKDSFRRKSISEGISIIIGKLKGESKMTTQAYRFSKDKFTSEEAKKWLKDHDIKYISFEPASEKSMDSNNITNNIIIDLSKIEDIWSKIKNDMQDTKKSFEETSKSIIAIAERAIIAIEQKSEVNSLYDKERISHILNV